MGLFKKLKKMHKKTIAHKLVSKDPIHKKLFGKDKKGKGGPAATITAEAKAEGTTTKGTVNPTKRPVMDRITQLMERRRGNTKPMQTGGPSQKSPVGGPTKKPVLGGPAKPSIKPMAKPMPKPMAKPTLRTGGGAQIMRKPLGASAARPGAGSAATLNRIAKGYNQR